ncbi:MAG TPA: acyl-CoA dehydrogenase family protein [Pseudomonadales bacterium]|nr:acyl-CoA dehydrogenase family protein [Pseudomonadales bacterium]
MSEFVAAAERLAPTFAARAADIEHARRIPADVSQAMAAAGFYRLFVPTAYGGHEVSPSEASRVFETLARADASCGWVAFIGATSGSVLARLPAEFAAELYRDPSTLITGVFAPNGRAQIVDGGFRVNGRWQWGSGSQNAQWVLGGCLFERDGELLRSGSGVPRNHMLLFAPEQIHFHDTWHVTGLRGSGSLDFEVRDAFVPEARAVGYAIQENPSRPLYQFPQFALLALGIGAVALGIARGAIDDLVALAGSKVRAGGTASLASRVHAQIDVATAEATLRSARAFYYEAIDAAWTDATRGQPMSVERRRDMRLATTHSVQASVRVVDAMYTLAGGSSVYESSTLQRRFRDVHVATQHIMVAPTTLETVGRLMLGIETNTQML